MAEHGLQCGFCTPGMMMTARTSVGPQSRPDEATIREAISGQICRCTGYENIVRAVRHAAGHPSQPSGQPAADPATDGESTVVGEPSQEEHDDNRFTVAQRPISAAGNPIGFGRMHRKEDARFLRGQGNYVDDVRLPGMLEAAILRWPYAHARILSSTPAPPSAPEGEGGHHRRDPGRTESGLDADPLGRRTGGAGHRQGPVPGPGGGVRRRRGPVLRPRRARAHRRRVRGAAPGHRRRRALDPDAPVIRDDIEGKTDNHIFDWEAGDRAKTDDVFAEAEVVVAQDILYRGCTPRRWRPAARSPTWTRSPGS